MKFITIDLLFMNKHGLSPQQAMFFSYLNNSTSWTLTIVKNEQVWFWLNRKKVVSDIPLVTSKTDTIYRWFLDFKELGLIDYKKIGNKDVFQLTSIGKKWNNNSDSHPTKLGQPSEFTSDGHPTDRYNSNIDKEDKDIVEPVIACLNENAGTSFKTSSAANRKHIMARSNEGFTQDDFSAVIRLKCRQWLKDVNMSKYLRPETLFGNKFESYLEEAKRTQPTITIKKDDTNVW